MDTFAIRFEPGSSRVARVTIGDFSESFEVTDCCWSRDDYKQSWSSALRRLLDGDQNAVALMVARCLPPAEGAQRAWVLHREGDCVYVRDRIWVPGDHHAEFDSAGQMVGIEERELASEDGVPISEWSTTVGAIRAFIGHDGAI